MNKKTALNFQCLNERMFNKPLFATTGQSPNRYPVLDHCIDEKKLVDNTTVE